MSAIAAAAETRSQAKMLAEVERYKVPVILSPALHSRIVLRWLSQARTRPATFHLLDEFCVVRAAGRWCMGSG